MGRKENIKRMKRIRAEKKVRLKQVVQESELDEIAEAAIHKLVDGLPPDQMIRRNTGPLKYSDLLKDFLNPYIHECRNFQDTRKLFIGGSLAWNIAVTSQVKETTNHEEIIKIIEKELNTNEVTDFIKELIDRKLKYFSQHKIYYKNVELVEKEKAFGISVAVIHPD